MIKGDRSPRGTESAQRTVHCKVCRLESPHLTRAAIGTWLRAKLSRVTTSGRFIPEIDGLRFVALAAVFLHHLNGYVATRSRYVSADGEGTDWLSAVFEKGGSGVQLFFAISGLILAIPFAEHYLGGQPRVDKKRYYWRRVTRLEPPYIINLLVIYVLLIVWKNESAIDLLPHLLASMAYVHNVVYEEMSLINGVAWSLEIEIQFYLLAPLLFTVFAIPQAWFRRGILVLAIVVPCLVKMVHPDLTSSRVTILHFIEFFAVGALLAELRVTAWRSRPEGQLVWDVVSVLGWTAFVACQFHKHAQHLMAIAVLTAYVGVLKGRFLRQVFSNPWIVVTGGMCYTFYLYHFFIIAALGPWTTLVGISDNLGLNSLIQASILFPLTVAVTAVLFALFERPFMRKFGGSQPLATSRVTPSQLT